MSARRLELVGVALLVAAALVAFGSVVLRVWDYQLDHSYVQEVAR